MPIDYLAQRTGAENELSSLVAGRNPQDELSKTMGNIQKSRSTFLGGTGLDPRAFAAKVPQLQRKTEGLAAKKSYDAQGARYNMIFNQIMDLAKQRGMDAQSAAAYARQVAVQNAGFDFTAGEAEKSRNHARANSKMLDEYSRAGIEMQSDFQPKMDYVGALSRVLLGTAASAGTSYYLNKKLNQSTVASPSGGTSPTIPNYGRPDLNLSEGYS